MLRDPRVEDCMSWIRSAVGVAAVAGCLFASPRFSYAQSDPVVDLSRVEAAVAVAFEKTTQAGNGHWIGPALSAGLDLNLDAHLSLAAELETIAHRAVTRLAGIRLSTGFFFGNERDPVPGRFFLRAMAGTAGASEGGTRGAAEIGGGADVLRSRTAPIGLHWEVGGRLFPGAPRGADGYARIGVVFGPRLAR
jgi:hypothetical protein